MRTHTYRYEVEAAIDQVLLNQAKQNELTLAYIRATILGLSAAIDLLCYLFPKPMMGAESVSIRAFALSGGWAVVSTALVIALRAGGYRSWMRLALPIMDCVMVGIIFINLAQTLNQVPQLMVNNSSVCSLLAISGGIRLKRAAAVTTTLLALANFFMVAYLFNLGAAVTAFSSCSILAAGIFGVWMTGLMRQQLKSETGRTVIERFLPKKVVEEAFRDPMELLAQPRACDATVVITDLRGFTAFSEKLPPQDVFEFLNLLQGALAKIVREHGGTVDKFMGDGMLAVFGAPEPLDDHASRALEAARAMQEAVAAINAERERRGLATVKLGIGIHSGPVVAGCLGSGAKIEFTVIGDTVNVASRIESLTKEKDASALASADTVRRAGATLDPIGEVTVRGRSEPLVVCALKP